MNHFLSRDHRSHHKIIFATEGTIFVSVRFANSIENVFLSNSYCHPWFFIYNGHYADI